MTYVVSDLHGYPLEMFKALLEKASFSEEDRLYVLGDVIDRGEDGIRLLKWMMVQPNVTFLLGNHEWMMMESEPFLLDRVEEASFRQLDIYRTWKSNGAYPTLDTIAYMRDSEIERILAYLKNAPLYKEITVSEQTYILVHGGLGGFEKDKPLEDYTPHDLLWTRPTFMTTYHEEKTVILGHTPTVFYGEEYTGKAVYTPTWINIDVGAAKGLGVLLLRLDDRKEFYGL